jgi:histidyl-tRNA synthetase
LLAIFRVIDADVNLDAKYGTNAPFLHHAIIILALLIALWFASIGAVCAGGRWAIFVPFVGGQYCFFVGGPGGGMGLGLTCGFDSARQTEPKSEASSVVHTEADFLAEPIRRSNRGMYWCEEMRYDSYCLDPL